jgi:hypothetical protein
VFEILLKKIALQLKRASIPYMVIGGQTGSGSGLTFDICSDRYSFVV